MSKTPKDPLALEDCDYDRKYFLVQVPDFDVDPVDRTGTRRMTSYLRLGTVPDDWKTLPGADLELAVHADYGIGGGRGDDRPVAQQIPGTPLPADPVDPRYIAPSPGALWDRFAEAVAAAVAEAGSLDVVAQWAAAEELLVAPKRIALLQPAVPLATPGSLVPTPTTDALDRAARPQAYPPAVLGELFAVFVADLCGVEEIRAASEKSIEALGLNLGGPTGALDEDEARDVIARLGLRDHAERVLIPQVDGAIPWTILAVTEFAAAIAAVRADAASRAAESLREGLTDYPDMLLATGVPKFPPFVDDLRHRGDETKECEDTNYLHEADRLWESSHLHTRGGWRDHSDGNRITTTYGDKVEVIRGNYKLMVLGRQDDTSSSNLVDYGGQVTQSDDNVLVRVEYIKRDGVWNWQTVNENVIQSEKVSGKVYSWWYGVEQIDIVGSDSPTEITDDNPMGLNDDDLCRANPELTSRTWARRISDYTGSSKLPVPYTYSETWADDTEEMTTITRGTKAVTTIGGGTLETTTIGGGTISNTIVGGGTLETTTVGGAAISVTGIVGAQVEITGVAATIIEATTSLTKLEASAHLVHVELAAVGLHAELKATGINIELSMTGLTLKGELSGPEKNLNQDRDDTATKMKHVFASYTRQTVDEAIDYGTRKERGSSKSVMLMGNYSLSASNINLG